MKTKERVIRNKFIEEKDIPYSFTFSTDFEFM